MGEVNVGFRGRVDDGSGVGVIGWRWVVWITGGSFVSWSFVVGLVSFDFGAGEFKRSCRGRLEFRVKNGRL